jgi:hypothetical protein
MLDQQWWIPAGSLLEMATAKDRQRARAITAEIAKIDFVLPGSLTERYLTCIHPGCHCHGDPPSLHGPYWYWTRKVTGKTVTKMLRPEQVEDYRQWFDNEKRLRALVHELESLSLGIVGADPRSPKGRQRKLEPVDELRSGES